MCQKNTQVKFRYGSILGHLFFCLSVTFNIDNKFNYVFAQVSLNPKCGHLVGFASGEYHGVKAITKGQRCAVALWFTQDPNHREIAHLQAKNIVKRITKETGVDGKENSEKDNKKLQVNEDRDDGKSEEKFDENEYDREGEINESEDKLNDRDNEMRKSKDNQEKIHVIEIQDKIKDLETDSNVEGIEPTEDDLTGNREKDGYIKVDDSSSLDHVIENNDHVRDSNNLDDLDREVFMRDKEIDNADKSDSEVVHDETGTENADRKRDDHNELHVDL